MYGHPRLGFGPEKVQSIAALVETMKQRQVLWPRSRYALVVGAQMFDVNLLNNGMVEVDGQVPTLARERELDGTIAVRGAILVEEIN